MELDDIWLYLGDFGRYQTLAFIVLTFIGGWLPAWQIFGIAFTSDEPPFHCRASPGLSLEDSGPNDANGTNSECEMYQVLGMENGTTVVNTSKVVDCTNGYEFQPLCREETTIVMELNLVCDQKVLVRIAQSIFYFGVLVGAFVFGQLSDLIGRKTVLLLTTFLQVPAAIAIYFVYDYYWFVIIWFFVGMFEQAMQMSAFVLLMEMFSPKKRAIAASINNILWGVGVALVAPIAYILKNWRKRQLAISLSGVAALPLWFVLHESVRWLLSRGRYKKAFLILKRIARFNSIKPPLHGFTITYGKLTIWEALQHGSISHSSDKVKVVIGEAKQVEEQVSPSVHTAAEARTFTIIDILKSFTIVKYLLILICCWLANGMVYFGFSLYSSVLAGNKYLNFFLLSVVEIPALAICSFTFMWWGRRPSLFLFHLLAGIACVVAACLPRDTDDSETFPFSIVVSALIGKFFITCSFGVAFVYTPEIFPTPIRNIGLATSALCGTVGSMLAPFIIYLDEVSHFIPLNIFGGCSLLAAALVLFLPETRNKPLPETIHDAEILGQTPPLGNRSHREGPGSATEDGTVAEGGTVNPAMENQDTWL